MKNKGISMMSLIITIILIIILASISSVYLSAVLEDVQYKDAKEEFKNVENVVEYAKTQILIDEFMPDQTWLITDIELENKFSRILTPEEIDHIKLVNASDAIKAPHKYYLMNQSRFDSEFGNDYNVSDLRPAREYLVNYMDTYVISSYEPERLANISDLTYEDTTSNTVVKVAYTPNGNMEWSKQQATIVTIEANAAATITSTKYLWSQSYTAPDKSEFVESLIDGQTIEISDDTGNDWYLWVEVMYKENGIDKTYYAKSEPFYIDNEAPTADVELENIDR